MEKIWPTPTGPGRPTLLPPSQCLDSTITAPTCPWHFQPGNKATKIVILAICLSQRWTSLHIPKNPLFSIATGSYSEHAAILQLELTTGHCYFIE